ncbi:MAG: bifunctional oligoribonuclease/PAP phosphatase NrnA [Armatimonadota bacterium]|nr:bifunctional oligoribonuclease/PAP phosphatase NrnA [Armatimonadota bacterium]
MMEEKELKEAADLIRRRKKFLVACHVRPDGDTLGSALALANALRQLGKDTVVVSADGVPEIYSFLPDGEDILKETSERAFDVAIVIDCDGIDRVGPALDAVKSARKVISIDHHTNSPPFGDIGLYNTEAAASGEIVLDLIDRLGVTLDERMAICLMTALVSDTGAFRFPNVTPRTFLFAAGLTAAGASASHIARLVYENRSLASARLMGIALAGLKVDKGGDLVWSVLSREDFEKTGAADADTEGVINHIMAVKGARVGLLFREAPDGPAIVSLRSRDSIDVSKVARAFGGGGHAAAAGCIISASLPEAERMALEEARKWMES